MVTIAALKKLKAQKLKLKEEEKEVS